jgi:UDP-N-acetylmuramate dehydrogenase
VERRRIRGEVLKNVPMKRYTSMKVGGRAPYLFYPADGKDAARCVLMLREKQMDFRFLGNGTNVIVADTGVNQALIRMSRMGHVRFAKTTDGAIVNVSGGMGLKRLIRECAERGLAGMEKLYGIPGTVGGALRMNAGSFGVSISGCLRSVVAVDGNGTMRSMDTREITFGYRASSFGRTDCILGASFQLKDGDRKEIGAVMEQVWRERRERHPMDLPSSGSIFKNREGKPCWQYIDQAGLRGLRIGDACVSEKHPNFIVNMGKATAADIRRLIEGVKKSVFEKTGVSLEEEVEFWGFDEE